MIEFNVNLAKVKIVLTEIGYYLKTLPPYKRTLRRVDHDIQVILNPDKTGAKLIVPTDLYRKKKLYFFDDRLMPY